LLFIVNPEELNIGIMEEEPATGSALSGMCIGLPFAQTEPQELLNFQSADAAEDKEMIEFYGHISAL
jgi:hypothetical protein